MKKNKLIFRLISLGLFISGIGVLVYIFAPIVSHELDPSIAFRSFLSPIPESSYLDMTKASNWFPDVSHDENFLENNTQSYSLSVPKLKIDNAVVTIGGEDLAEHLIQYPGTAVPGKIGNSVVFGHSILPQFFNPKNYLTIFSTLHTLKIGDQVFANFDGVKYSYKVQDRFEVSPKDIQILEQPRDASYITLVTCSPPGDPRKPKRLVVRAKLVPLTQADAKEKIDVN